MVISFNTYVSNRTFILLTKAYILIESLYKAYIYPSLAILNRLNLKNETTAYLTSVVKIFSYMFLFVLGLFLISIVYLLTL